MNQKLIVSLSALALLAVVLSTGCDAQRARTAKGGGQGAIAWTEDVNAALQESARTGKPVMLDFFATWCMPCKIMDRQTYPDADVIDEAKNWIAVRVDVDRNAALAERYRIQAVPTLVFVRPDGTESSRLEGFVSAGGLSGAMKKVRESLPRRTDSM